MVILKQWHLVNDRLQPLRGTAGRAARASVRLTKAAAEIVRHSSTAPPLRGSAHHAADSAPTRPASSVPVSSSKTGRAAAAYQEEFSKWAALIDAIACDLGLSKDQRAAAVVQLRAQGQAAASAAQQMVAEEEAANDRAYRRYLRQLSALRSG